MFEATKVGRTLSKQAFKAQEETLRADLLQIQQKLLKSNMPVVVLVAGVEGAGKGELVNQLNKWLDTRGMQNFAFWDETDEERERPRYWRFWRTLSPRGQISVLFGGWYLSPIEYRFKEICNDAELDAELNRIVDFERMLTLDGALIVKFWFHMPQKVQKERLKALSRDDRSKWKMHPQKKRFSKQYALFEQVAERVIRHTDRGIAPWYLVEATDSRYRDMTVGRTLLNAIRARLEHPQVAETQLVSHAPSLPEGESANITILDHVDLETALERKAYRSELSILQSRANLLAWEAYNQKRSVVMVFEGWDAGGKGGAIRRFTSAVDARLYRSISVAAPTDEEKAHHYLWRFWRHLPRAGYITIYDRSWYGRVLVERVEGFASEAEWHRAYAEINRFEEQLIEGGTIILKFWLHIDKDEQLRRFKEREKVPYKQHKITEEDWRNREKWDLYKMAVNEMVVRTSTEYAPWTLVPGNDKLYARVEVLKTICDTLERALKHQDYHHTGYLPCAGRQRGKKVR
jgi:polyphosphate:AMP phosphotransferase